MLLCQILHGKGPCFKQYTSPHLQEWYSHSFSLLHQVRGKQILRNGYAAYAHLSEHETHNQILEDPATPGSVLDPSTHGDSKLITLAMSFSSVETDWKIWKQNAKH